MQTLVHVPVAGAIQPWLRRWREMSTCITVWGSALDMELSSFWGLIAAQLWCLLSRIPFLLLFSKSCFCLLLSSLEKLGSFGWLQCFGESNLTKETMGMRWTMDKCDKIAGSWSSPEAGPLSWCLAQQNWPPWMVGLVGKKAGLSTGSKRNQLIRRV